MWFQWPFYHFEILCNEKSNKNMQSWKCFSFIKIRVQPNWKWLTVVSAAILATALTACDQSTAFSKKVPIQPVEPIAGSQQSLVADKVNGQGKSFNVDSLTFIAKLPANTNVIAAGDTYFTGQNEVILDNGLRLKESDLFALYLDPNTPLPKPDPKEPRLSKNLSGVKLGGILWSNGDMVADEKLKFKLNHENGKIRFLDGPHHDENLISEASKTKSPLVMRDVKSIASSAAHNFTIILRKNGHVHAIGYDNDFGHLGVGQKDDKGVDGFIADKAISVAAGDRHGLVLRQDGSVWMWGQDDTPGASQPLPPEAYQPELRKIELPQKTIKIAAFGATSFALTANGKIWAWGRNDCDALGLRRENLSPEDYAGQGIKYAGIDPVAGYRSPTVRPKLIDGLSDVVDIGAGLRHGVALKKDGTVWGWGWNNDLAIGVSEYTNPFFPIYRSSERCTVPSPSNIPKTEPPRPMLGVANVKQIFVAKRMTVVVKNDNSLWYVGQGCKLCTTSHQRHVGSESFFRYVNETSSTATAKAMWCNNKSDVAQLRSAVEDSIKSLNGHKAAGIDTEGYLRDLRFKLETYIGKTTEKYLFGYDDATRSIRKDAGNPTDILGARNASKASREWHVILGIDISHVRPDARDGVVDSSLTVKIDDAVDQNFNAQNCLAISSEVQKALAEIQSLPSVLEKIRVANYF
jgi:Regulator of chromosome condensation (RCC1) repeat